MKWRGPFKKVSPDVTMSFAVSDEFLGHRDECHQRVLVPGIGLIDDPVPQAGLDFPELAAVAGLEAVGLFTFVS